GTRWPSGSSAVPSPRLTRLTRGDGRSASGARDGFDVRARRLREQAIERPAQAGGVDPDRPAHRLEAERPGAVGAADVGPGALELAKVSRSKTAGGPAMCGTLHVVDDGLQHRHHEPALRKR